jgi:proteasome lid subunit RPN8/RPN11
MQMEHCLPLPLEIVDQIILHAQQYEDTEICGLISKSGNRPARYYAVKNIAADPSVRFEMDPKEQIAAMKHMRDHGEQLLAIVHSHPETPPVPSAIDIAEIGYPDVYTIIVSLQTKGTPEMRAYRMVNGVMQPVVLECK